MDSIAGETNAGLGEYRTDRPISSLFKTTKDVLLSPRRFFDELPPDGPLGAPVLYYLICLMIGIIINVIVGLAAFAVPIGRALVADSPDARPVTVVLLVL